ncbi:MAG: 4-hydroxythreonine-4-phosphate dehydrogenase PdxA [Candidatus Omnitrophica bacterium]|nr:4-hydroxythreonine-4-phosphate dehydrogenase PdxA [Candidatus Omnitrophota bacterium]
MSKSAIKTCVAITMGDPRGIGPEVILKSLQKKEILALGNFILIGDRKLLGKSKCPVIDIPYQDAGEGSVKFLDKGIELIKGGVADALVTAPLSKEAVSRYRKNFTGHTEYLAESFQVKTFDMMFVSSDIRLSLVTRHMPLKDVPKMITKQAVFSSIELMNSTLKEQFGIRRPRIAVWSLNPHAGEQGLLGSEEMKQIIPAIQAAQKKGILAKGPYPADTFFCHDKGCDGIVAMYHDQGLTPLKGMYFKNLVNFTAGLPFVRTSPVHGTALDIAGQNKADPSSMIAAIQLAFQLA